MHILSIDNENNERQLPFKGDYGAMLRELVRLANDKCRRTPNNATVQVKGREEIAVCIGVHTVHTFKLCK